MSAPFPAAMQRFPRLRQSQLAVFDACALSSRFDMDLRSGWSSHPAARGQIVHRTIAKCLADMVAQGESRVPINVALQIFEEVLRQHDVPMEPDEPMGDHVVSLPLREIASARVTIRTWAKYSRYDIEKIAGIEKRLRTTLSYPDPAGGSVERELTGKLDLLLIDGTTATVVDYKDTFGIPPEGLDRDGHNEEETPEGDNISEQGFFQMRVYSLLVGDTYPRIERVVMREVYPRYLSGNALDRKGRPINPVRQATIERYVLPEIRAEMSALVERFDRSVETGVFRPAPGSHCSYCPRPDACTIFPTARAEGRIGSLEEAEKVAGRLNTLDALKKQSTKALRAWANIHGPVRIRDAKKPRVYGPLVRTRTKRPDPVVLERHLAQGGKASDLYRDEDYVWFGVHSPDEQHPHAAELAREEEALLAMQRAADERKAKR
jgi:hypothetical protein